MSVFEICVETREFSNNTPKTRCTFKLRMVAPHFLENIFIYLKAQFHLPTVSAKQHRVH